MLFSSFFDKFPDLIESEFRNLFVSDKAQCKYIPPGNYGFLEMFCSETDCDCRKVMIHVITADPSKLWAVINYGWESEAYYKTWWGTNPLLYQPMSGIALDSSTDDPLKKEFLHLFQEMIRYDSHYARRIESHYFMFKEAIPK